MKTTIRRYTHKQMGDACEMLVAAELTLAGIPSMKGMDYWPGDDVIKVQPALQERILNAQISDFLPVLKILAVKIRVDEGRV